MKDDTIIFRVSKELKEQLEKEANLFEMRLSDYMRHFLDERFNVLPDDGE
jgi:hypothetical protein